MQNIMVQLCIILEMKKEMKWMQWLNFQMVHEEHLKLSLVPIKWMQLREDFWDLNVLWKRKEIIRRKYYALSVE